MSSRPKSQIYYDDDDGGEKMTEKSFFNYAGIPKNWRRISSEVLADQLHPLGSENVEAGNTYTLTATTTTTATTTCFYIILSRFERDLRWTNLLQRRPS